MASFSAAHRSYVKSLYRRMLKNELDWVVRRDIWRGRAMVIRAEFERNRYVSSSLPWLPTNTFLVTCTTREHWRRFSRKQKRTWHPSNTRTHIYVSSLADVVSLSHLCCSSPNHARWHKMVCILLFHVLLVHSTVGVQGEEYPGQSRAVNCVVMF